MAISLKPVDIAVIGLGAAGGGARNPALTIQALWRTAKHLAKSWKAIAGA